MKGLTVRQRRFVEAYAGNATEAAVKAGYSEKTARSQGQRLLTNADIQAAIQGRTEKNMKATIADRQERQEFWTAIMRDEEADIRDRTRASELLGKSEGDFLERVDHSNTDGSLAPVVAIDLSHLGADEIIALTRAAFEGEESC
ncbi:MAG: terminase small subunit [Desulfovibrio sp.]|jgi:phage terminase small subunit|nr:terminase small subunit [Desulfovibrio sp.]